MSYIYKIKNSKNSKLYIGKTEFSLEQRFEEHCRESRRQRVNRPLYNAMNKYGIENFSIEKIEECTSEISGLREQYWIGFYHSYSNGYNATLGGEGKTIYDHKEIIALLSKNPIASEVALIIGCSSDTVRDIAKANNIQLITPLSQNVNPKKRIQQLSLVQEEIQEFDSVASAAKWCFEEQKCKTLNSGVRSHIAECANFKRKTAYGYIWRYID